MQLHLNEIAREVAPGRHAVLLLDQAGWHTSRKLDVPGNLTLVLLPAKCPELNPDCDNGPMGSDQRELV